MSVDDDAGAAVARRRLGNQLRALREAAHRDDGSPITIEQAAEYMERARPTLYRIEHGLPGVRIKNHDVTALCDLYGASDEQRKELLALAAASRIKGWFHKYGDVLPPGFDIYVGLEAAARSVFAYEPELVHGLMQTEDYAREILSIGRSPDDPEIDQRVTVRLRRQEILTRTDRLPAQLHWLVGEAGLRQMIGGPRVMAAQLTSIAARSEQPNITVQVIPFGVGAHVGVETGPFAILQFADGSDEPPTVYTEHWLGHILFHKPADLAKFDDAATAIINCALGERRSRDFIHRLAKEFSQSA